MVRRREERDSRQVCGRVQYHCTRLRVVPTVMLGSVQLTRELCASELRIRGTVATRPANGVMLRYWASMGHYIRLLK